MRRLTRRWYFWFALFLLVGLAAGVALVCSSRSRITQANFERVKEGMTEEEVIAILGKPSVVIDYGFLAGTMVWNGAPGTICISFWGEHGTMSVKTFTQERHKSKCNGWSTTGLKRSGLAGIEAQPKQRSASARRLQ